MTSSRRKEGANGEAIPREPPRWKAQIRMESAVQRTSAGFSEEEKGFVRGRAKKKNAPKTRHPVATDRSLIAMCDRHHVNPESYLADVLIRIPGSSAAPRRKYATGASETQTQTQTGKGRERDADADDTQINP